MTFIPHFASPCDLAEQTPAMVTEFLDLKTKLARDRNESSVTDILVSSLIKLSAAEVTVIVPYEPETGSDIDILILNSEISDAVQYILQAKKLSHNNVKNWRNRSYKELDHPHGTGDQSKTLISYSAHEKVKTVPLYMFYNDQDTCSLSGNSIEGIALADAHIISRLVKDLVQSRPKRLPYKRIGHLSELFFPFSTILCASHDASDSSLISPARSLTAAREALARTRVQWGSDQWEQSPELMAWKERESLPSPAARLPSPRPTLKKEVEKEPNQRLPAASRQRSDRILPMVVENALARRSSEGVVKASVRRTKVVLKPG